MNSIELSLEKVGELIFEGIAKWIEAGELLCEFLDQGGSMTRAADITGLSTDILSRFEQIGRRQIHPKLLASTSPGTRSLSRCSYSVQEKHISSPIEVLTSNNDTLLVDVDSLTSLQCRQVFSRGHIRTLPEQRAWMESEKTSHAGEPTSLPYSICGKTITFHRPVSMTKKQLERILLGVK